MVASTSALALGELPDLCVVACPLLSGLKIDGFVVTPTMLLLAMSSARLPDSMRSRGERSSSHTETPAPESSLEVGVLSHAVLSLLCE
jgi:hypothetical protein